MVSLQVPTTVRIIRSAANGGEHVFDWYFSGTEEYRHPLFRPAPGVNKEEVGRHPVNGAPIFVLTHHPPADYPRGPSNLTFVTDGIESAIRQARAVAGVKDIKLGGASPGQQALAAGLCDEILIHLAPYLLGSGVRLFGALPALLRP